MLLGESNNSHNASSSSHLVPAGYSVSTAPATTIPSAVFPKPSTNPRRHQTSENSALKNQLDLMTARLNKIERVSLAATTALEELPDLYNRIEDMDLRIAELESALLKATSGTILTDKDQQVVLHARDNNINVRSIPFMITNLRC